MVMLGARLPQSWSPLSRNNNQAASTKESECVGSHHFDSGLDDLQNPIVDESSAVTSTLSKLLSVTMSDPVEAAGLANVTAPKR
jgi:hypothetical protein